MGDRGFPHAVSGFSKPTISILEAQYQVFRTLKSGISL
jgi:hypothetical protein